MHLLYRIFIALYGFLARCMAIRSAKARQFVAGRKNWKQRYREDLRGIGNKDKIWIHCASLGEFEQGRPVIEQLKSRFPEKAVILTFFSPSGYELRHNYEYADAVWYLPLDTAANARYFVKLVQPQLVLFVKYEFWYNYINALHTCRIPVIYFSALFQPRHIYFKWYGGFFRKMLRKIDFFFVQNQSSIDLLGSIGITQAAIAGDTRFDRAHAIASTPFEEEQINKLIAHKKVIVAGSTWPEDEALLQQVLLLLPQNYCLILAPHEINTARIRAIQDLFGAFAPGLYTRNNLQEQSQVLIIDTFGKLAFIYREAHAVWIGGGFNRSGIHNTVEAAVYGKPVFFGPHYSRFQEAYDMLSGGSAKSFDQEDVPPLVALLQTEKALTAMGVNAQEYVAAQLGATQQIMDYIVLKYFSIKA